MAPRHNTATTELTADDLFVDFEPDETGSFPMFTLPDADPSAPAVIPVERSVRIRRATPIEKRSAEAQLAFADAQAGADACDWRRARTAMARALDLAPSDPELHAAMAWYTHRALSTDVSERDRLVAHHMAMSHEVNPTNHHAHFYQGRIFVDKGNPTRARLSFDAALESQPDFYPARAARTRIEGQKTTVSTPMLTDPDPRPMARTMSARALHAEQPRKVRLSLIAACIALVLINLAIRPPAFLSTDLVQFTDDIGTGLRLVSAKKINGVLTLDFGDAWKQMPANWGPQEIATIASGTLKMGYDNVYVYAGRERVGEGHAGRACLGRACGPGR